MKYIKRAFVIIVVIQLLFTIAMVTTKSLERFEQLNSKIF